MVWKISHCLSFATVWSGGIRATERAREHKMAPKEGKCVFMGIPRHFPTGTVSVLLVRRRKIVERQAVQWVDGRRKTGGDGGTGGDDRGIKSAGDDYAIFACTAV